MARRRVEVELAARNLQAAMDLTPEKIISWDAGLWRGPRMLVPIIVEALVVDDKNAAGPWANVKVEIESGVTTAQPPQPFDTYANRPKGIHLHWALPDGLTRGTQVQTADAEKPPVADDANKPEQPNQPADQQTDFPRVPDRWLVIRMHWTAGAGPKRRATAWVIESEQTDPARRVTPLADWKEDRVAQAPERWLTAIGTGDPAYAAYYDNVQNVLGFHDALADVPTGPLTYLVVGWYADPEQDALHQPQTREAWFALLDQLRWSLEDGAEERLEQAARNAQKELGQIGLNARFDTPSPGGFILQKARVEPTTGAKLSLAASGAAAPIGAAPIQTQPGLGSIADISRKAILAETNLFLRYWPRQTLCHGMVYDIAWNGVGGSYNTSDAGIPPSSTVGVSVGNTGMEALSALVAGRRAQPNLEKILTAFHYGVLPELGAPDGVAALEALVHSAHFASRPGGFVVDTIEEGDVFPRRAASETLGVKPPLDKPAHFAGVGQYGETITVKKKFIVGHQPLNEIIARAAEITTPSKTDRLKERPRKTLPVRRAMPRYYEPVDPVVLLDQARRSYKHGGDGRFSLDGKLVCRLTGETIQSASLIVGNLIADGSPVRAAVTPRDLTDDALQSGQIPPEASDLYHEALLLDETNAPVAGRAILARGAEINLIAPVSTTRRQTLTQDTLEQKMRVEQTMLWNPVVNDMVDGQTLAALSGLVGKLPSKLAVQAWRAPWTPLHLDWEVQWFPSPNLQRDWTLQELDLELNDEADPDLTLPRATYTGRNLLTPGAGAVLVARLQKFLEDEKAGASDLASGEQERALRDVIQGLSQVDVLATSLSGLHDALIGREEKIHITDPDSAPSLDETTQPTGATQVFPVRAGHLRLKRLRVVDAFSQIYDADTNALTHLTCAEDVAVPNDGSLVRLAPRLVPPSRLMFRLLNADPDAEEATKQKSPVCGWILPDHLDEALEVYDAHGVSQGQVQLHADGTTLEWQGVPGQPEPWGAPPTLANPHAQRFVEGLLSHGVRDTDAGLKTSERSESALSALLRMIDATLWSVDALGREGDEHVSVLVGRPLALVRAELRLETLMPTPTSDAERQAYDEFLRAAFEMRLGALTRLHDGLMGYFVNDDYSQFYPVHEAVALGTRPSGPQQGFLGAIQTVDGFYRHYGDPASAQPVIHPYINTAPTIRIRPQQRVRLTLLIDPRGAVHVTPGILPRKRIDLMREHVAAALDAITLTFRVGPVLTDPETIRMPLPAEIRGNWSWVRRTSATVWREDTLVKETDNAKLSDTPATITEGWLKLSGGLKNEPKNVAGD